MGKKALLGLGLVVSSLCDRPAGWALTFSSWASKIADFPHIPFIYTIQTFLTWHLTLGLVLALRSSPLPLLQVLMHNIHLMVVGRLAPRPHSADVQVSIPAMDRLRLTVAGCAGRCLAGWSASVGMADRPRSLGRPDRLLWALWPALNSWLDRVMSSVHSCLHINSGTPLTFCQVYQFDI